MSEPNCGRCEHPKAWHDLCCQGGGIFGSLSGAGHGEPNCKIENKGKRILCEADGCYCHGEEEPKEVEQENTEAIPASAVLENSCEEKVHG